jgi:transcriptional regulator with GAF, ATPase, and Fis domain
MCQRSGGVDRARISKRTRQISVHGPQTMSAPVESHFAPHAPLIEDTEHARSREVPVVSARPPESGSDLSPRTLQTTLREVRRRTDQLQLQNVALREEVDRTSMFEQIVGVSPQLRALLADLVKVAPTEATVLITGETGTGKELVARAIHRRSSRAAGPFVSVNCAAIASSLIASELFGHEKGAFTGAAERRRGRFELADGGTLFLDEVGDLAPEVQLALLRVLQERQFERVGGSQSIRTNLRLIAATNRDMRSAVAQRAFRADLFYRLNVFPLEVPPLRERPADIPLLVEYFVDRFSRRAGKRINSIGRNVLELMKAYDWPGNIRELQNVIERAVIVSDTSALSIDARWLLPQPAAPPCSSSAPDQVRTTLVSCERQLIEATLTETRGRVSGPFGAAARLGVPPSTLESKIKALDIDKRRCQSVPAVTRR